MHYVAKVVVFVVVVVVVVVLFAQDGWIHSCFGLLLIQLFLTK